MRELILDIQIGTSMYKNTLPRPNGTQIRVKYGSQTTGPIKYMDSNSSWGGSISLLSYLAISRESRVNSKFFPLCQVLYHLIFTLRYSSSKALAIVPPINLR